MKDGDVLLVVGFWGSEDVGQRGLNQRARVQVLASQSSQPWGHLPGEAVVPVPPTRHHVLLGQSPAGEDWDVPGQGR